MYVTCWYRNKNSKRKFLLEKMSISFDRSSKSPLYVKALRLIKRPLTIKDSGSLGEIDLNIKDNVLLQGYWESYKYFSAITGEIKKEFALKNPSGKFIELSKKIKPDSIAIHVRRGDYLIPHGKYLNGADYYNKGVECILKNKPLKDPLITIFSDDPKWCKEKLKSLAGQPTEIFDEKLDSDAEELMLMSFYGNNVISNSTFSWWAAYLNKNPDKIVVMPRNWFTDPAANQRYLASISVPGWMVLE